MTVSEAMDAYLSQKRMEGVAEATVEFYQGRFARFRRFAGDRLITDIKAADIIAYAGTLPESWSPTTTKHNLSVINIVQNWLYENDFIERKWAKKVKMPSARKRKRIPTAGETAALHAVMNPALSLMYEALRRCGARPGELCKATFADWRRDQGVIVLEKHKTSRKTGRARLIAVSKQLRVILDQSTAGRTEGHLFLTMKGKPWSPQYLSHSYTKARKKAGLDGGLDGLKCYLSRHEFGTAVCKAAGVAVARDALGHTNISTTSRYVHPDLSEVKEASENVYGDQPVRIPTAEQKPQKPRISKRADVG
jgi:integrase/recombinase XerD